MIFDQCEILQFNTDWEIKRIINLRRWHLCTDHAWVGSIAIILFITTVDIRGPSFHNIIMSFYDSLNNIESMGVFLHLIYCCEARQIGEDSFRTEFSFTTLKNSVERYPHWWQKMTNKKQFSEKWRLLILMKRRKCWNSLHCKSTGILIYLSVKW